MAGSVVVDWLEQGLLVWTWVFSMAYDFWAPAGPALSLPGDNIYILSLAILTSAVVTTGQDAKHFFLVMTFHHPAAKAGMKNLTLFRIFSSNKTALRTVFL